jgi:hypothetical protein
LEKLRELRDPPAPAIDLGFDLAVVAQDFPVGLDDMSQGVESVDQANVFPVFRGSVTKSNILRGKSKTRRIIADRKYSL